MLNTIRTDFSVLRFITITGLLVGLLFFPAVVNSDEEHTFTSFMQKFATGEIDWKNGIVYGTGRAFLDQNAHSIPMALRAATSTPELPLTTSVNWVNSEVAISLSTCKHSSDSQNMTPGLWRIRPAPIMKSLVKRIFPVYRALMSRY